MKILQVSAEIFPLVKTGGLADIAGALPAALRTVGCDPRVLLPGFPPILADLSDARTLCELVAPWGDRVRVRAGNLATLGLTAYVLDVPHRYDRPGSPYEDAQRQPYADNHLRFALLGFVAAQLAQGLDPDWQPELVHCHDWHAGLAPAYMAFAQPKRTPRVPSVYTVHNLAYQGVFDASVFAELGLPPAAFAMEGLEFYGQVSFMKAGLFYADRISTVSPTYAKEIQTPEQGCGLDGLLRARSGVLSGILNAVDESVWNPAHDPLIPFSFDATDDAGKARCKASLQQEFGLAVQTDAPLFVIVSRLTEQKGLHLVLGGLDGLLGQGGQLIVLGSGDAGMEQAFRERAAAHSKALAVRIGYDENLAHRLFAASDVTLVPSRFEPCGLTQMYGLKYGSLPLVHRVGGLADTVVDSAAGDLANGFVFDNFEQAAYDQAVRRAIALYAQRSDWVKIRTRAMGQALGWQLAAGHYLALYRQAIQIAESGLS
jgi:starch synthase